MAVSRGDSIIPRSAATSLTTPEFRWLHAEAWGDEQMAAFLRLRQAGAARNLAGGVPYESGKRRPAPQIAGRWLLERSAGKPCAAVEALGFLKLFRTVHLAVSDCEEPGGWADPKARAALSLMVSGVMILTRADVVVLLPQTDAAAAAVAGAGWGEAKSVLTPEGAWAQGDATLAHATIVEIDPHAWWELDNGAADRATLSYLEKRMDTQERKEKALRASASRRREGLFGRLGRLLRWD